MYSLNKIRGSIIDIEYRVSKSIEVSLITRIELIKLKLLYNQAIDEDYKKLKEE